MSGRFSEFCERVGVGGWGQMMRMGGEDAAETGIGGGRDGVGMQAEGHGVGVMRWLLS